MMPTSEIHTINNGRICDVSFVGCDVNEYLTMLIGPKFADYRKRWATSEKLQHPPDFPLFLQVETVDGCNLKCKMCYRRLKDGKRIRQMNPVLFQRIIDEVHQWDCPSICLNGNNEPLLDPLLPERIAMAHAAGVLDSRINTNGMLLTEDVAKRLIQSGLTRLSVSIDASSSETYRKIRSGGVFNKVLNNVERFISIRNNSGSRLPVLRVTFVVLQDNQHEQDDFVKYWSDKADYISFQRYVPHTRTDLSLDLEPTNVDRKVFKTCPQPFQRLIIDVVGNVFPCCSPLGSNIKLGTLKESTVYYIWSAERIDCLRSCFLSSKLHNEPVCALCLS